MVSIIKEDKLPSTNNAWGFGGTRNRVRYTLSNGHVWISGIACYRHLPDERYIQRSRYNDPMYTGGILGTDIDVVISGSPRKAILKRYNESQ